MRKCNKFPFDIAARMMYGADRSTKNRIISNNAIELKFLAVFVDEIPLRNLV